MDGSEDEHGPADEEADEEGGATEADEDDGATEAGDVDVGEAEEVEEEEEELLPILDPITHQVHDRDDLERNIGRIKPMHDTVDIRRAQLSVYCRYHQCSKVHFVQQNKASPYR